MKHCKLFTKMSFVIMILFFSFGLVFGQIKYVRPILTKQTKPKQKKKPKAQLFLLEKGELTSKTITQGRKISEYDQGGYFDCREQAPGDDPCGECDEKKIRDFIWQHWTNKKRGYVRVTYNSVDSLNTSHIFIEPNANGAWKIEWRIARFHVIPELNNRIDDVPEIITVDLCERLPSSRRPSID